MLLCSRIMGMMDGAVRDRAIAHKSDQDSSSAEKGWACLL